MFFFNIAQMMTSVLLARMIVIPPLECVQIHLEHLHVLVHLVMQAMEELVQVP